RREHLILTEPARKYPIVLNSETVEDVVHVKLPAGFKVDEVPDNAKFSESFGRYEATFQVNGDDLVFTRQFEIRGTTIPASEYKRVREFFGKFWSVEQAAVVLVKK